MLRYLTCLGTFEQQHLHHPEQVSATHLLINQARELEEVLLQQWQARPEETLQGRMHGALQERGERPEGILLAHVQQEQARYETHALYVAHLQAKRLANKCHSIFATAEMSNGRRVLGSHRCTCGVQPDKIAEQIPILGCPPVCSPIEAMDSTEVLQCSKRAAHLPVID